MPKEWNRFDDTTLKDQWGPTLGPGAHQGFTPHFQRYGNLEDGSPKDFLRDLKPYKKSFDTFKDHGILVKYHFPDRNSLEGAKVWVLGDTYPVKDIMKRYSFRWRTGDFGKGWVHNPLDFQDIVKDWTREILRNLPETPRENKRGWTPLYGMGDIDLKLWLRKTSIPEDEMERLGIGPNRVVRNKVIRRLVRELPRLSAKEQQEIFETKSLKVLKLPKVHKERPEDWTPFYGMGKKTLTKWLQKTSIPEEEMERLGVVPSEMERDKAIGILLRKLPDLKSEDQIKVFDSKSLKPLGNRFAGRASRVHIPSWPKRKIPNWTPQYWEFIQGLRDLKLKGWDDEDSEQVMWYLYFHLKDLDPRDQNQKWVEPVLRQAFRRLPDSDVAAATMKATRALARRTLPKA